VHVLSTCTNQSENIVQNYNLVHAAATDSIWEQKVLGLGILVTAGMNLLVHKIAMVLYIILFPCSYNYRSLVGLPPLLHLE